MKNQKTLTTLEEIKAFSDPYRMQILSCIKSLGNSSTVKQIADKMGETPAKIHYHVKKLEKVGILCLDHTEEVNGIIAKYYRITAHKFEIKREGIDPAIQKAFLNETQRMISAMYERSKQTIIEQLEKEGNSSSQFGDIGMTDVYFTESEAQELKDMIHRFYEEHSDKANPDKSLYHLFTVFMPIESKDKK